MHGFRISRVRVETEEVAAQAAAREEKAETT
jgi:hypothetical protein